MRNYYGRRSFLRKDLRTFKRPYYPDVWDASERVYEPPAEQTVLQYLMATNGFFASVYLAYEVLGSNGTRTETQVNVGVSDAQLATDFAAFYGEAKLGLPFELGDFDNPSAPEGLSQAGHGSAVKLKRKVQAVLDANKPKYYRMMELYGFDIQPSIQREEIYNEGVATGETNTGHIVDETTDVSTNIKTTHNVATYDGTAKKEYDDTTEGTAGNNKSHITGEAVKNYDHVEPLGILTSGSRDGDDPDWTTANANADSLLITTLGEGQSLPFHDFKATKHIITDRDPNEYLKLVEADMAAFRLSLEEEFFKDVAKEILLPII